MPAPGSYFIKVLFPFTYFFNTRIKTIKVLAYNFLNELLPNLLAGLFYAWYSLETTIFINWILSYLAFIAVYEIGYYVNDAYSVKKESELARKRLTVSFSNSQFVIWLFIRLACWGLVTYLVVPEGKLVTWLFFYLFLGISFSLHNVLQESYRGASFICLAFFRFFASGIIILPTGVFMALVPGVLLCYLMPRLWAYQESKGQLIIKDRRQMAFKMAYLLIVSLILLFMAIASELAIFIAPSVYFLFLTGAIWIASHLGIYKPAD